MQKSFLIESETGYYNALVLATDPVDYLEKFRVTHLDDNGSESDVGILAIEHMREMCQVISHEHVPVSDTTIQDLVQADDMSMEWGRAAFQLLKDAEYPKACLKTWLLLDEPFLHSDDECNAGRSLIKY